MTAGQCAMKWVCDPPLVAVLLVVAERGVPDVGPRRRQGPVRRGSPGGDREVPVAVVGARPVVGQEQDEGVVERAHLGQPRQQPPDVPVHPVDHRRVDGHLQVERVLLGLAQALPWPIVIDVAPERPAVPVHVVLRRAEARIRGNDPELLHARVALRPHRVPAPAVRAAVARDVLVAGLQGIVGDVVRHVEEERLAARLRVVEEAEGVVGQDVGLVERRVRDRHVLDRDLFPVEEERVLPRAVGGG